MRGFSWKFLAVLGPVLLVAVFGYGLMRDPSRIPSVTVGTPAPAFALEALDGGAPVVLADYRGRVVMINFWASWCVSCRIEHDVLVALGHAMAGRGDVAAIGINYRDTAAAAHSYLVRHGPYPYGSGTDPRGRTGIDYGVYGLPETYFLDREGRIAVRHIGPIDRETAHRHLAALGVEL